MNFLKVLLLFSFGVASALNLQSKKEVVNGQTITTTAGIEMVFVQVCTSEQSDCGGDKKPVHREITGDFYMSKYEVTQKQWKAVMGKNPSKWKGGKLPVERISWYDAVRFCNKLSEREGLDPCYAINGKNVICDFSKNGYRLPTEAEWEYAARGGLAGLGSAYKYAGSNDVNAVAWYKGNSGDRTHKVGTKTPNELGLYDMSGNVWEWCHEYYYSHSSQNNSQGPDSTLGFVLRGGSWYSNAMLVRVSSKLSINPSNRYYYDILGCRLVRK